MSPRVSIFERFLTDGGIELDSNIVERLQPSPLVFGTVLPRYLFAGLCL